MYSPVLELSRVESRAGKTLGAVLATRALLDVAVRDAATAHQLLVHARHQLSLQFRKDNPEPALQVQATAVAALRSGVESVSALLSELTAASNRLDELGVVQEAPNAVAGLARLLEDNQRRTAEVLNFLKLWQESLILAARV